MPSSAPASTVRGSPGWTANPNMRLSDHRPVRTCRQLSPPSGLTQAPVPTVPTQIVKLLVMALSSRRRLRRFPAGVGDVDHHPVGAGPFHLEVAVAASGHFHIEAVFLGETLALRALHPFSGRVEILDLYAEVMDAAEIGTMGADIGRFLGLPIEDRHIEIPVGQKDCAVRAAPDLLQSESLLVEGRGFRGI